MSSHHITSRPVSNLVVFPVSRHSSHHTSHVLRSWWEVEVSTWTERRPRGSRTEPSPRSAQDTGCAEPVGSRTRTSAQTPWGSTGSCGGWPDQHSCWSCNSATHGTHTETQHGRTQQHNSQSSAAHCYLTRQWCRFLQLPLEKISCPLVAPYDNLV